MSTDWRSRFHDWRQAPEHYGAIHFHDDDVHYAGWPTTFEWRVPRSQRSGVYALKLEAEGGPPFWITFFVRPARRARGHRSPKRAAFLASTATYQVYANYRSRMVQTPSDLARGTLTQIDPTEMLVMHMPDLGGSRTRSARSSTRSSEPSPPSPAGRSPTSTWAPTSGRWRTGCSCRWRTREEE